MNDWESQFRAWARPPGTIVEERVGHAEKAMRDAIRAYDPLNGRDTRILTQGSYKNNTNVRQDSDVDVAVVCYDTFFPQYPDGTTATTFGNSDADYQSADKVGELVVFNIAGNRYCLIASIHFNRSKVYIRHMLTHKD